MRAQKDTNTGKWYIQYRYTDWQGHRKKSTKRGFNTKREAEEWLRNFLQNQQRDVSMNFGNFVDLYFEDMESRLRESTIKNKRYIIDLKILPYFEKKSLDEIKPTDIRMWQNELLNENYAGTYLKTINNQLNALFNYAVRYLDLESNPCSKAGSIGKSQADKMEFWTKDEFDKFLDGVIDKQVSYVSFMILYWTGIRIGELLALTPQDFDLEENTMLINKSYQRIDKRDVITEPKTPKSIRTVHLPDFLVKYIEEYINSLYGIRDDDRIFPNTRHYFTSEMKRGIKKSKVKKIRLHDLRHSHASLLIELGFPPLQISERLGHERIETTLNTYSHLYPDKHNQLAEKLNEFFQEETYEI